MQKSDTNQAVRAHRRVGASTTLNRRYVRRPQKGTEALEASVKETAQVEAFEEAKAQAQAQKIVRRTQPEVTEKVQRSPKIARFSDEVEAAGMGKRSISIESAIENVATKESAPKRRSIKIKDEADRKAERLQKQAEIEQRARKEMQQEDMQRAEAEMRQAQAQGASQRQFARQRQIEEQMLQGNALAPIAPATTHPLQAVAMERMRKQRTAPKARKLSAKEIKDREIKKALASSSKAIDKDIAERERAEKRTKLHFSIARVMLAISCTAAAVMAIVYFVGTNMPDISMRVAAMQTGIRASYPSYVPRGFNMSDLSSEDGRVSMNFRSDENGDIFTLMEENSSWDSNALEMNYVKKNFADDYSIVREQGLTIYFSDHEGAAWVNGGVVYKIEFKSGELTKKQVQLIATSL